MVRVGKRGRARWYASGVLVLMTAVAACSSGSKVQAGAEAAASATPSPGSSTSGSATSAAQATWQDPWLGRADVSIFLCGAVDERKDGCAGGAVTAAQRDAIRARLQTFPEIQQVFYESSQEAYEAFARLRPEDAKNVGAANMPESFRVKLRDPSQFSDNVAGLRGMPGVYLVTSIKPR